MNEPNEADLNNYWRAFDQFYANDPNMMAFRKVIPTFAGLQVVRSLTKEQRVANFHKLRAKYAAEALAAGKITCLAECGRGLG